MKQLEVRSGVISPTAVHEFSQPKFQDLTILKDGDREI